MVCALTAVMASGCGQDTPALHDACVCGPEPDAGTGNWQPLSPVIDGPVQETATVAIDGKVYVVGGFDQNLQVLSDLRVYDIATDTWSKAAPLPRPMHHANAAAYGGKLYVLGGLDSLSFTAFGDSFVYDPSTDAWMAIESIPAGTERGSAFVGVVGRRIHIAGGLRGGVAVSDHSAYDTLAKTWSGPLPPLPTPRDHGAGAGVGTEFLAIGGRSGTITGLSGRVDRYDTETATWSPGAEMLTARGGTAAGVIGTSVVVVGGEGNNNDPDGVFAEVEIYRTDIDSWRSVGPMLSPRHGMSAASWDGKLYVPGGADQQGFGAVDTNEVYTPWAP